MIAIDVETHQPDPVLGRVVCMSVDGEQILTGSDIPEFVVAVIDAGGELAAHNAAFDFGSIARTWPRIRPTIEDAYARGQIRCTMLWSMMHDIAAGRPGIREEGLDTVCSRYDVETTDESTHPWRCRFGELEHVPVHDWPEAARAYSLGDTRTLAQLWRKLGPLPVGLAEVCERFFYLAQSSQLGIATHRERVSAWQESLYSRAADMASTLMAEGLVRPDLTRNMAAVRGRISAGAVGPVARTKGGAVSTADEHCREHPDPVVRVYGEYGQLSATISRELPIVLMPRVHTRYGLAETFRTRSSKPNLQNMTEDSGVRECFCPDEGHVFICVDYGQLELCALGQICVILGCGDGLATELRNGIDMHTALAHDLGGIEFRKLAKAGNFGFPGGMGPDRFSAWARSKFELEIDREGANRLRQAWRKRRPEVVKYQRLVADELERTGGVLDLYRSGRIRGGLSYTEGCNTLFQSLGADVTLTAFVRLARAGYLPSLYVHDEYLIQVRKEHAERAREEIATILREVSEDWLPACPSKAVPVIADRWVK